MVGQGVEHCIGHRGRGRDGEQLAHAINAHRVGGGGRFKGLHDHLGKRDRTQSGIVHQTGVGGWPESLYMISSLKACPMRAQREIAFHLRVNRRVLRGEGQVRIDGHRQRLVVDLHCLRRVLGLLVLLGDHQRHWLTGIIRHVRRQNRVFRQRHIRCSLSREVG